MKNRSKKQLEEFVIESPLKIMKKHEYNGLTDPNLHSFFASPSRRKILIRQKLVS